MTNIRLSRACPGFALEVDFLVGAGITALFGPAGSGKSLILEMVAGFAAPAAGRILFDDAILYDSQAGVDVPPSRRAFGYLSRRDSLFPHLTLRRNLDFAARRLPRRDRHRRVAAWLEKFDFSAGPERYPRQLSPEEKLRGALARMLSAEPKLLLLDDCGRSEALLLQLRSCTAVPILPATRNLDLCCAAATQLLLLDAGRIVQSGDPRQVVERPAGVDAARLLGIPNLFQGSIAALDPFRNSSLPEFEHFSLSALYLPGHLKGDRISVAVRARSVRLEFDRSIYADVSLEEFAAVKKSKQCFVEFPPAALQIL